MSDRPPDPPPDPASGWSPPDDGWDRPVLRLRSAWLAGLALLLLGGGLAIAGLTGALGTGAARLGVAGLGILIGLVGLTFITAALQAWMRLRRGP